MYRDKTTIALHARPYQLLHAATSIPMSKETPPPLRHERPPHGPHSRGIRLKQWPCHHMLMITCGFFSTIPQDASSLTSLIYEHPFLCFFVVCCMLRNILEENWLITFFSLHSSHQFDRYNKYCYTLIAEVHFLFRYHSLILRLHWRHGQGMIVSVMAVLTIPERSAPYAALPKGWFCLPIEATAQSVLNCAT